MVVLIPMEIGAFETVTKDLERGMNEFEIGG